MAKESNIVHRYFKKKFNEATILVKVNPILFKGIEITLLVKWRISIPAN